MLIITIMTYAINYVLNLKDIVKVLAMFGLRRLNLIPLANLFLVITIVVIVVMMLLMRNKDEKYTARVTSRLRNYFESTTESLTDDMTDEERTEITKENRMKKAKNDLVHSIKAVFTGRKVKLSIKVDNADKEDLYASFEEKLYNQFRQNLNRMGDYSLGEWEREGDYMIVLATKRAS